MGKRLVVLGSLSLAGGLVCGLPIAQDMPRRYTGAPIEIRDWMGRYNQVVACLHVLVLLPLLLGLRWLTRPGGGPLGWPYSRIGQAFLSVGIAAAVTMLVFPLFVGSGPWLPDSTEIRMSRVLVFVPGLARSTGLAMLVLALARSFGRLGQAACWSLFGVLVVDVGIVVHSWVDTPTAVVARLHALDASPWGIAPPASSALGLLGLVTLPRRDESG